MNVLSNSYYLAMQQYRELKASLVENGYLENSNSVNGNDISSSGSSSVDDSFTSKVESAVSDTDKVTYSDGSNISYNGTVQALSNSKVQQTISQYNIDKIVSLASEKYNIPEQLIYKVIETESYFNVNIVSSAGATGLMQIMPANFSSLGITDGTDPYQNIMGGVKLLRQYIDMFDGDLKLGLAAYNAGPGNVKKYGGVPPFKETQNYIKKILG